MKILIVNGLPRAGKSLFCNYAFRNRGLVYPMSTIDEVKRLALLLGWDGEKDEKGRKFLSDLKDSLTSYNDLPRRHVLEQIDKINKVSLDSDNTIFLIVAREPKEIAKWKEENNAKSLFIYRQEVDRSWGNHADDNVSNYDYDYYLNNSLDEEYWENRTIEFIDQIRNENWESHI